MFRGREEAALKLAKKLEGKISPKKTLVLALARGGVVVGKIIATYLGLPLDVLVLKKISDPQNSELALGVIGPKNTIVWNEDILRFSNLSRKQELVHQLVHQKEKERKEQEMLLRKGKRKLRLKNKTVILVDDGVATGATVLCAQKYLKKEKIKEIILAVPVVASDTLRNIKEYFDGIICLKKTLRFFAVGQFYKSFPQVTNEEVINLLK
jgi:putative phosphoribosyl transferase